MENIKKRRGKENRKNGNKNNNIEELAKLG